MTRGLYAALALQLIFFAGWGGRLLTSHRDVGVVWLATEPVDPRDLLSGNYVALRYGIARTYCDRADGANENLAIPVWVQLVPNGDQVPTAETMATLSSAIACRTTPPNLDDGTTWIMGRLEPGGDHITFGIERMFVGEDNPLRTATSGSVIAKVAINDTFEPRLLGLMTIRKEIAP
ncbi:MAG: GDYXXLXY domain-containing protein [Candidatus Binatia bacterium]